MMAALGNADQVITKEKKKESPPHSKELATSLTNLRNEDQAMKNSTESRFRKPENRETSVS